MYSKYLHVSEVDEDRLDLFRRVDIDSTTLVSIDETNDPSTVKDILEIVKEKNCGLSLYLEGPGGKTGSRWDKGEIIRLIRRAKEAGVSGLPRIKDDVDELADDEDSDLIDPDEIEDSKWMREWVEWGWLSYFKNVGLDRLTGGRPFLQPHRMREVSDEDLAWYTREFYSTEIDNLYRHLSAYERNGDWDDERVLGRFGDFIAEFAQVSKVRGYKLKIVLKNLSLEKTEQLADMLRSAHFPDVTKDMLAGFHIVEKSSGKAWDARKETTKLLGEFGVRFVKSLKTSDYWATNIDDIARKLPS